MEASVRVFASGVSSTPAAAAGRSDLEASSRARCATVSAHCARGTASSTRPQVTALRPVTPSGRVHT